MDQLGDKWSMFISQEIQEKLKESEGEREAEDKKTETSLRPADVTGKQEGKGAETGECCALARRLLLEFGPDVAMRRCRVRPVIGAGHLEGTLEGKIPKRAGVMKHLPGLPAP